MLAYLLSRFVGDAAGRGLLVIFLVVAAGAYFGFAIAGQPPRRWLLIEVLHCVAFGAAALAGWRGSAWWLAAGWALHPVWDVAVHYYGPGRSFTPWTYPVACVSFDLVVALYVAVAYGAGWLLRPGLTMRRAGS